MKRKTTSNLRICFMLYAVITAFIMSMPAESLGGTTTMQTATGNAHTLVLESDGSLFAWGWNNYGQLGDGTNTDRWTPVQIGTDNNWVSIAAGYLHTAAIKSDGTLWAWGGNYYGQLGDGTNTDRWIPVQIGTDNNWVSIAAGGYHTIALKSDGTLWAWGWNNFGQLGNGTHTDRWAPKQIGADTRWVFISAGVSHTVALKSDGTLWAWGNNAVGQLGDGTNTERWTPVQIGTDNNWVSIAAGYAHTIALKSDGTLWAWGLNNYGQLGDGTNTDRWTPVQIGIDNWVSIDAGDYYTVTLKSDGTLWAWGLNNYGQLGDGTNADSNVQLNVNNPPSARAGGPYSGTEGQTIILDGSGSVDLDGNIVNYEWDTDNDGTYDYSSTSPARDYANALEGTYTIRLRVTDNGGLTAITTTTVTVANNSPAAGFTVYPASGDAPLTINFTNSSSGGNPPLTYVWDFDFDGSTDSALGSPVHQYLLPGIYTVKLTATDVDLDQNSLTLTDYITVCYPPLNISGDSTSYASIQAAYNATGDLDTIECRNQSFSGGLNINRSVTVYMDGGYDCLHSTQTGSTSILGDMTVNSGLIIIQSGKFVVQ